MVLISTGNSGDDTTQPWTVMVVLFNKEQQWRYYSTIGRGRYYSVMGSGDDTAQFWKMVMLLLNMSIGDSTSQPLAMLLQLLNDE